MKGNGAHRKSQRSSQGKNNLKPVLDLLHKLATRMDRLDKKVDSVRKEAAQEFKRLDSFRKETAQEFKRSDSFRKETAEQFKASRKEMKQEIKSVREDMAKYYLMARDENRIIANEHARTLTKIYTTMDAMAKDYSRWLIEKQYNDVELERHSREIKELVEKDTEKSLLLDDLQKRVVALEKTKNGGTATFQPEPQLKE